MSQHSAWPELPIDSWEPTRDTLTLWLQVVGKIRMARTPLLNHWWNATLFVTSRGLTTSLMPDRPGRSFSIDLDFLDHRLDVTTTRGQARSMELAPKSVSEFYTELTGILDALDLATEIWPVPVEIPDAIPFPDDDIHSLLRPRGRHRVLADARGDRSRLQRVQRPIRRQVQPGPPLLGRPRPGDDAVLGPAGSAPPGRRAQLRAPTSCTRPTRTR